MAIGRLRWENPTEPRSGAAAPAQNVRHRAWSGEEIRA